MSLKCQSVSLNWSLYFIQFNQETTLEFVQKVEINLEFFWLPKSNH